MTFAASVPVESVIVPAAASTDFTTPATPFFCHSSRSCCCFSATSAFFITTAVVAAIDLPSSDGTPADEQAIANLHVTQLDCRSGLQIGLPGLHAHQPGRGSQS